MSSHQTRGRARSLIGARGARIVHRARENREEGYNDNHHESEMGGEAHAFGGNFWVVGGAPPTVISGTEFMQGVFTAIEQVVRNTVQEMLVLTRAADTKTVIRGGVNETRTITHPKSQHEVVTNRDIVLRAANEGAIMHIEEEHSGSFGLEGSEDSGTSLHYDISNGTVEDSRTIGATVGCLCYTRYFLYD
ncbi:hypothetical protein Acr_00g0017180 [Actinidia rufa]|uniref:Uncharacterized protein n=1 Tax=Actinidia rufa TaxID=165716 RepID=A0A7J0DBC9_9ERIC|nr:hypothetical protein Acr_00g0017180 [Actinidia rufa]